MTRFENMLGQQVSLTGGFQEPSLRIPKKQGGDYAADLYSQQAFQQPPQQHQPQHQPMMQMMPEQKPIIQKVPAPAELSDEQLLAAYDSLLQKATEIQNIIVERKYKDWIPPILNSLSALEQGAAAILITLDGFGIEVFDAHPEDAKVFQGRNSGRLMEVILPQEPGDKE